jgi:hypothetical protein
VLVFPDGTVVVIGCDGDRITVPVRVFGVARTTELRQEIEKNVPGDRLVPMPAD